MISVDAIQEGTVIDHIMAGKGKKVLDLLEIGEDYGGRVALVMNVPSKKMGKKDIVKIEGKFISEDSTNRIALVASQASINIIRGGKVEKKYTVTLPQKLENIGKCPNPNCITNFEKSGTTFHNENGKFRCLFCERLFVAEELI